MARKSQHSVNKRRRELKKAEKAEHKRLRRALRQEGETKPAETPESIGDDAPPAEEPAGPDLQKPSAATDRAV